MHKQVRVSVNASVDAGVVGLVEALNAHPKVTTTSSCQDHEGWAYVSFYVPGGWRALARFIRKLSIQLGKNSLVCDISFTLSVEWYAGNDSPIGNVRVRPENVELLAQAVARAIPRLP